MFGTDADVLFAGPALVPGRRKGDNPQIAKVPNKADNPQIINERKKNADLKKQLSEAECQIEALKQENQKLRANSILTNMEKKIDIFTVRVFGKAVEEDIFLHNVSDILGECKEVRKMGGARSSF